MQGPTPIDAPTVDVEAVLRQDSIEGKLLTRFGIKTAVSLTKSNGTLYDFGNFDVWKLVIRSDGAKSLNFEFEELMLPVGSAMYVYSPDRKRIFGSVEAHHVQNGKFATDIVVGEEAVIDVFLPEGSRDAFSIKVSSIVHGITEQKAKPRAFGASADCNVNVVCDEGDGWENETGAICLILVDNTEWCSGSLINSECSDFTPYILTANHCIDGFTNFDNWVFRFRYESATCPEQVEPVTWFSFTGAQLRANWADSDVALFELNNPVTGSNVGFAGWNREVDPPRTTVVCIHHPAGDVKKISIDNEPPTAENDDFIEWFVDDWDTGSTEGGSSGSPLFDENHLIIGQDHRGDGNGPCDVEKGTFFGRFDASWDGGGTDETRLSTWLGGIADPMTMQGALVPTIFGGSILCTTSQTYTLQNPLPGHTISWSVTPITLFGSPTSGTGANASLWASNNLVSGEAILTYTLSNANCGDQTFSHTIWVGRPATPIIQAPACFIPGSNVVVRAIAPGATNYFWS